MSKGKSPASILKAKRLIPKEWDLRKPLSPGQKSWITKQSKKYAQVIRRPDEFSIRRVSKSTAKTLKETGFAVEGNRAIIPTRKQKVSVKGGRVVIRRPRETWVVVVPPGPNLMERIAAYKAKAKPLKPNQAYSIQLGPIAFGNRAWPSLDRLEDEMARYLERRDFEQWAAVVLVTVERNDDIEGDDFDEWEANI